MKNITILIGILFCSISTSLAQPGLTDTTGIMTYISDPTHSSLPEVIYKKDDHGQKSYLLSDRVTGKTRKIVNNLPFDMPSYKVVDIVWSQLKNEPPKTITHKDSSDHYYRYRIEERGVFNKKTCTVSLQRQVIAKKKWYRRIPYPSIHLTWKTF